MKNEINLSSLLFKLPLMQVEGKIFFKEGYFFIIQITNLWFYNLINFFIIQIINLWFYQSNILQVKYFHM